MQANEAIAGNISYVYIMIPMLAARLAGEQRRVAGAGRGSFLSINLNY